MAKKTLFFHNNISIPALMANNSLGVSGQVLSSNGTGLYWGTVSAATGSSANTQILFNDSANLNGSNAMVFDKNSNTVTLTGSLSVGSGIANNTVIDHLLVGNGTTVTNPSDNINGNGTITFKGSTSDLKMQIQNGNGRFNLYWNAYTTADFTEKRLVSAEPSAKFQIHTNASDGAMYNFFTSPANTAGSNAAFTQIGSISGNSVVWFSPRGNIYDFRVENNGQVTAGVNITSNGLFTSTGTNLDAGFRLANPIGARDYRILQKDSGYLEITDETASAPRITISPTGVITFGTNLVWHAGNDGSGSGLDADLLDGYNSSDYFRTNINVFNHRSSISNGYIQFQEGNTTNPGYISFHTADTTRVGYIGWNNGASRLLLSSDGGWFGYAFNQVPFVGGSVMWCAGNDGSGSGLDADLLDGYDSSAFAMLTGASFSGNIQVNGSSGAYAAMNTGGDITACRPGGGPGVIYFGNSGNRYLYYDGTQYYINGAWLYVNGGYAWTSNNDGAGSGLDADLLDGLNSSDFFRLNQVHQGGLAITRTSASNDTFGGLEVRENGLVSNAFTTPDYAPGINFHWGSVGAARVYLTSGGQFVFAGQSDITNNRRDVVAANFYSNGSLVMSQGNDGSGSGFDADLLDGYHATSFARLVAVSNGSTSGYEQLSNGRIFQWTTVTASASVATSFSWPLTFTTISCAIPGAKQGLTFSGSYSTYLNSTTTSGGSVFGNNGSSASSTVCIFAIGTI